MCIRVPECISAHHLCAEPWGGGAVREGAGSSEFQEL